jgi:aspartyl-tRNA(Asn)/glutamyl-tRNA(Gln) amidotransferase subunit C
MQLSREEVIYIAELARLKLSDAEIKRYGQQLSAIIEYFAQLQLVDTTDITPTSSVLPSNGQLRNDISRLGLSLDDLLQNAPATRDNQFLVPPALEK